MASTMETKAEEWDPQTGKARKFSLFFYGRFNELSNENES